MPAREEQAWSRIDWMLVRKDSNMNSLAFKSLVAAAVAVCSVGTATAYAADNGFYLGGSLGFSRYHDSINGVSGDGTPFSGKVFGGYQINRYMGVEAGYADLGRVDNSTGNINGHAEYLDAVGTLPLGDRFSLLGSAGFAHVGFDTSAGDGSGNGLKLGVGAEYALTENVALRALAELYRPDTFNERPDIAQYTLGARVAF